MRPYRPNTSAKIRIKIIPTNNLGCWAVPRTPASPTMPMAKPAAKPEKPTANPAPRWMNPLKQETNITSNFRTYNIYHGNSRKNYSLLNQHLFICTALLELLENSIRDIYNSYHNKRLYMSCILSNLNRAHISLFSEKLYCIKAK